MKIILVNLDLEYPIDFWPSKKQSIGIGYIAAVLIRAGHDVYILEERFEGKENLLEKLSDEEYDIAAFNFIGLELSISFLRACSLKEAFDNPLSRAISLVKNTHPQAKVIAGGYSATFWDEELLRLTPTDFICRGESESTITELSLAIENKIRLEKVRGISWIHNGKIYRTSGSLPDINQLPKPVRLNHNPDDWIMINSSRGCYGRCSFCSTFSLYGEPTKNWWRGRTAALVIDEIEELNLQGYRNFQFAEDDFIGRNPQRAKKIAGEIIRRGIQCSLRFDCRADEVTPYLFQLLKEAGLKRIYIGCESGCEQDLRLFRKGITVEQNTRAVSLAKSLGIQVNPGIIMFHPFSTLRSIEDNILFLERLEECPMLVQLASEMFVYKGTPLYRQLTNMGALNLPLTTYKIIDPAARWVHDEFMAYAIQEQQRLIKKPKDRVYRQGDKHRKAVYHSHEEHLTMFKKIVAQARRKVFLCHSKK